MADALDGDPDEQNYIRGHRAAWAAVLGQAIGALGMRGRTVESLLIEREGTIAALRSICAEYGDNDWDENLHLADVIEKHLARHLEKD